MTGYRFLLTSDEATAAGISGDTLATIGKLGGLVVSIDTAGRPASSEGANTLKLSETDGLFAGWQKSTGFKAALVRPDRYLYGGAQDAGEAARLVESLAGAMFGAS